MVTKQQQLEWLAKAWENFTDNRHKVFMSVYRCGDFVGFHAVEKHEITKQEWQQEREKMQKQGEKADSWHERGELPPVGEVCEFINTDDAEWHSQLSTGSEVEILAHYSPCQDSMTVAVFAHKVSDWNQKGRLVDQGTKVCFRPLRAEREKAIDEMIAVISSMNILSIKSIAEKLYDAGCRMEKQQ